jgi:hypothetical protein
METNVQETTVTTTPQVTVGVLARKFIKQAEEKGLKLTNEELALKVVEVFKKNDVEVKTSAACIAWYKNDMRKKGQLSGGGTVKKSIQIDLDDIDLE